VLATTNIRGLPPRSSSDRRRDASSCVLNATTSLRSRRAYLAISSTTLNAETLDEVCRALDAPPAAADRHRVRLPVRPQIESADIAPAIGGHAERWNPCIYVPFLT